MPSGFNRTVELIEKAITAKRNLVDTLVDKGEEASFDEPLTDLIQKAGDYIPKSYIFVDESGNEIPGVLVDQETVFDATANDIREGKVAASELGVVTGEKDIPSYYTIEGIKVVTAGSSCSIPLSRLNLYDFTKLQVIICAYNTSLSDSVSAEQVSINGKVYKPNSTEVLSTVTKNATDKSIELGITNETDTPLVLRYFTYKEIY